MKKLIEWFISLWQPKKLISCEDVCTPELLCETPPPETFQELYDSKCAGIARGITGDEWISEGGSELRCFTRFEYLSALKVDSMMKPRVPMTYTPASTDERDDVSGKYVLVDLSCLTKSEYKL